MKNLKLILLFQIVYLGLIFIWVYNKTVNSGFSLGELLFFFISISASIIFGIMLFITTRLKNKKQQKLTLGTSIILTCITCLTIAYIFTIGQNYYEYPWNNQKSTSKTKSVNKYEVKLKDTLLSKPPQLIPEKIDYDITTDNRFVYMTELIEFKGTFFIKVDYVDFLSGKEALEAEWRDKAYFIDGKDTISNMIDGHYISNVNPKIRTFKIAKDALIENMIDDSGIHKMKLNKSINSKQLKKYIELNTLLFIHFEKGIIKSIDERFIP